MKILVTGDAHLGRYPSRIPDSSKELSVGQVWEASVDWAIGHKVDAVVLTGDMADNKNSYFEAYSVLKRGIDRLVDQAIPVYAVAGNHDFGVFPRLVEDLQVEGVKLLGPGGTWSRAILHTASGEEACLTGWSFPQFHFRASPLDTFPVPNTDIPVIGVVHGDLDGGQSDYAPLITSELQQQPVAVWLLGHIHAPKWIPRPGAGILYPGSLQALDPGEPGPHGPWLITISQGGKVTATQLPLATVRYETVEINVSGLSDLDQIESGISRNLQRRTEVLSGNYPALRRVIYRPELTGKSRLYRAIKRQQWTQLTHLELESRELRGTVDRITPNVTPYHDLAEISGFSDPPGVLAQWLLDLKEARIPDELRDQAVKAIRHVLRAKAYAPLGSHEPDPASVEQLLIEQGELLLDELMNQKIHE
ncbi:MAG: DNA repair exonuclease [Bacteroidota bacterium]|nr:DNA repair exonuclease [Bacteroidota bacterium]